MNLECSGEGSECSAREDPLADLGRPEARGLIYGISTARNTTSQRLGQQDAALGLDESRTIDAYNQALAINAAFGSGKPSATGIFRLRAALREADRSRHGRGTSRARTRTWRTTTISRLTGPGRVNFYSERKDPPAPIMAVAHPAHHARRRWYKPWTWLN